MTICHRVVDVIEIIVRMLVTLITWVVRTVCDWVSTVITTAKEVCEEVCGWLGPFSFLCDWVCKIIEVVETVWEWVCEEVLEAIIRVIEIVATLIIYIFRWVCWVIELPIRLIRLWWCRLGFNGRRILRVCAVILADEEGNQAMGIDETRQSLAEASRIFAQCNIAMVVESIEVVPQAEYISGTTCNFGGIFSGFFSWFSSNARPGCLTVYFVSDIVDACGCAYPGANWVTVAAPGDNCSRDRLGCVIAQEIGHLADLWSHSDDVNNNVMANPCGPNFTRWQCCMIRTSRFTTAIGFGLRRISVEPSRE